jgi:hypothetical protein
MLAGMRRSGPLAGVTLLGLGLYVACSSTSTRTTVACEGDEVGVCRGENDCIGSRVCQDESFGECVCDDDSSASATGATTTGSGGTTSSGTTGSTSPAVGAGGVDGSTTTSGTTGAGGDAGAGMATGAGGGDACTEGEASCGPNGNEVCDDGRWVPCPLDEPACEEGECVLRGPALVSVASFYVDSTEVTVTQYGEFLAAKDGDISGQAPECDWNMSYESMGSLNPGEWPITYVDWCDAAAFCTWAGKRLCGALGGGGIAQADFFEPGMSQWFLACGGPEGSSHPNGDAECNSNGDFQPIAPVGTFPGCEGFYPGLFDLEGNVAEWVDACERRDSADPAADICYLAGGSIIDNQSYCTEAFDEYTRETTARPFGFRCCSG